MKQDWREEFWRKYAEKFNEDQEWLFEEIKKYIDSLLTTQKQEILDMIEDEELKDFLADLLGVKE